MAATEPYFVEWKEHYVSKERGNRVVHYFLKDNSGESILAVVGTERSVRHMFYVVSDEFLNAHGAENSAYAGFRWRSRREVVNWLTSMLSKQDMQGDRPSENLYLSIEGKSLRVSRDWTGDRWVDVESNPKILSINTKLLAPSAIVKEPKSDNSHTSCPKVLTNIMLSAVEEEIHDLEGTRPYNGLLEGNCYNEDKQQVFDDEEKKNNSDHANEHDEKDNADSNPVNADIVDNSCRDDGVNDEDGNADGCKEDTLMELEIVEQTCEAETTDATT